MNVPNLLGGMDILLVEDESLISLLLEDMLRDLGATSIRYAGRLSKGLELLVQQVPSIALLDVNLAGEPVFPLAEKLAQQNVSIIFLTGYGRAGVEGKWSAYDVIQKPFTFDLVTQALRKSLAGR